MEYPCQNCGHITSSGTVPRFCSQCGNPFSSEATTDAATIPPRAADAATIPPDGDVGRVAPARTRDRIPAEQLDGFEIVRELGRGGMGVVYEAREQQSGRSVALKLLSGGIDHSSETVERFLREGQIAASLSHPRSTFIYDAGEIDGRFYITMELMPGGTIKDIVDRQGKLSVTEAVNHTLDMLDGLQAAHEIDVVHRDVKPSNCFLTSDNRVKVGDFGISKSLVSDASLTMTGAFIGTPQFAAPEQIRSAPVDGRTDVYSAGATLFYMLTGRAPFYGDAISVVADIASEPAPTLKSIDADIPDELSHIVARTLEKNPDKRPQSAHELRTALLPFSDRHSSISDVGRRMAAFFIDSTAVSMINVVATWSMLALLQEGVWAQATSRGTAWVAVALAIMVTTLYYSICESRWGRGLGKTMMGLRVVNRRGEAPSFPCMVGRSLLVPGVADFVRMGTSMAILYGMGSNQELSSATSHDGIVVSGVTPLLGWLAGLLMLATMRERNGFRGVHELVSGTRTVRIAVTTVRAAAPVTLPKVVDAKPPEQFEIVGQLASTDQFQLFAAKDTTLGRPIWLLKTSTTDSPLACADRAGVTRSTRQHLLRTKSVDGERWDAMEAVSGAPIAEVLRQEYTQVPWRTAQQCLVHLAQELETAEQEGTLPANLSLGQVWFDSAGRVKLLDLPLDSNSPTVANGTQLMQQVLQECRELLPARGLDVMEELSQRSDGTETLSWLAAELAGLGDRSGRMTWDERLGILAISFGTEFSVTGTLMSLTCMLTVTFYKSLAVPLALAVALPIVSGWVFRGGPVFRIARVQVRRKGAVASPLRCAVRNLIAWFFGTTALGVFSYWVTSLFFTEGSQDTASFGPALVFVAAPMMFVFVAGALCTLVVPRRGIQDLIAGTELVAD